jgi:hypothetical protein
MPGSCLVGNLVRELRYGGREAVKDVIRFGDSMLEGGLGNNGMVYGGNCSRSFQRSHLNRRQQESNTRYHVDPHNCYAATVGMPYSSRQLVVFVGRL